MLKSNFLYKGRQIRVLFFKNIYGRIVGYTMNIDPVGIALHEHEDYAALTKEINAYKDEWNAKFAVQSESVT